MSKVYLKDTKLLSTTEKVAEKNRHETFIMLGQGTILLILLIINIAWHIY